MTIKLSEKQRIKLLNSDDVYSVMQDILIREDKIDRDREHFWLIGLAPNFRILYIELVSLGTVSSALIEPMNVFRVAVLKGAVSVILVHNHPHGELRPSDADKSVTDRLIQVGRILDIRVNDHLIISTKSFLSFEDIGLMKELRESTEWVPKYELIEKIKIEEKKLREEAIKVAEEKGIKQGKKEGVQKGIELGKKKGIKEGIDEGIKQGIEIGIEQGEIKGEVKKAIEIAGQMIFDNEPVEKIMKYTGLKKGEIMRLKKGLI